MSELCDQSAVELRRQIGVKEISPVELTESCIRRVEAVNGTLNAMVSTCFERALDEAKAAEQAVVDGEFLGALHGLPVAIKDLESTEGLRTTFGSKIYEDNVPAADQLSVANVRDEGGIIIGKTNTPEFGAGANTRNLVFGATGNPFDPVKTCAGSSGGSAVALAAGMVPLASGSDYGGSLRTPAAFCGVVGFRPSPGVVPAEAKPAGLLPFSVLGPMGRSVADTALLLSAQASADARDPYSGDLDPALFEPMREADLGSMHVAISADLGCAPISKANRSLFKTRTDTFRHVFAEAQDRDPDFTDVHECFEVLRGVVFVGAHGERVKNHRDIISPNVVDNVDRGLEYSLEDVAKAHLVQTKIARNWISLLNEVDCVICPAASVSPFPHAEWYVSEIDGEQMPTYMRWLAMSYAPTMAMACGCVLPCGLDDQGMPFGIQVLGAPGRDRQVLEIAAALERQLAAHADTARPLPDLGKLSG
ncbi:amidase family protein [Thalassospiraceae bacterium LMO-JJ14]|nr:amidase family protein [Thalassospiraceae bacterium LMO-JJ14]